MTNERKSIPQPKKLSPPSFKRAVLTLIIIVGGLIFSEMCLQWVKQIGWAGYDLYDRYDFSDARLNTPGPYGLRTIPTMAFDSNDTLWVGGRDSVFALTPDGRWKAYTASNSKLPRGGVAALAIDNHNRVWVGTESGLGVLTSPGWTWETVLKERVIALATDQQGQLWVATEKALSLLSNGKWRHYTAENSELSRSGSDALIVDQQGQVWTSDWFQIDILTPNGSWIKDVTKVGGPTRNDGIQTLAIDKQSRVWIGTLRGLFVCNSWICAKYNARNSGLAEDTNFYSGVYALAFDSDNRLWISTRYDLRVLEIDRALPAFLLQGLGAFRWLENITLFVMAYLYVVRQLPKKNNALIGALGGGLASLIAGYLFFSLPSYAIVMTVIGMVIGLVAGFAGGKIGGKIGGEIVAYVSGGVAAIAFFFCLLLIMSPQ